MSTEDSKRTWSLPLPVQPWATYLAPNWWATATRCFAMSGRDSALTSGYLFSYMALASMAQERYSLAKVSRMSMTAQPMAPVASALA